MTWLSVAFLHPDVAVVLRHAGLRVQEGHADAALGTETGIVAAAVFYGLPVELVAEPENRQSSQENVEWGAGGGRQGRQEERNRSCYRS